MATTNFPTPASHPFYTRLNQRLAEHYFDDFVEGQCQPFYAEIMGRPGLPPGMYFRLLLKGSIRSPASRERRPRAISARSCAWHPHVSDFSYQNLGILHGLAIVP